MPASTRYLSWDRLVQYDELVKKWVLKQISEGGGISEAQARAIFTEMFNAREKSGTANDIRTYEKITSFPLVVKVAVDEVDHYYTTKWESDYTGEVPSDNVEYVDRSTQVEYIWKEMDSTDYSGEYVMVNTTASSNDISNIFK